MAVIAYSLYFPGDPDGLFKFLEDRNKPGIKFLLWVDNNDHKVSSQFYTLRKYIRKGFDITVFINPPLGSESEVFDWLAGYAQEQGIIHSEEA